MSHGDRPFRLKWAGGKRWLADALVAGLGTKVFEGGLCEPFAGGAALAFASRAPWSHLSDTNLHLIDTYRAIKMEPAKLAESLANLDVDRQTFERIRADSPSSVHARAVRAIYLNRTAFGGLWRVNAGGQFNVPFGCKPETRLPNYDELLATSRLLKNAILDVGDFIASSSKTTANVVYFDPPYTVAHNQNGFVRYNERIFSWVDQERLANHAAALAEDGRTVIVSNAFHPDLRSIYRAADFKMYRVRRATNLAANSGARGWIDELLVVSRNTRLSPLPTFATQVR